MQFTPALAGNHQHLRLDRNEPTGRYDLIGSYPDDHALVALLATRLGIATDRILLTAGADQGLDVVCRATNGPVVVLHPDFIRYEQHSRNAGLRIVRVPAPLDGSRFPMMQILDAVEGAGVLIVSTVANPTGCTPPPDFIDLVKRHAPSLTILIDEVYAEFAPVRFADAASTTPGVISIGSLSKIAGPGLRVGYMVAEPTTLARVRPFVSPAAVSGLSLETAGQLLANPPRIHDNVRRQVEARGRLGAELRARGFAPVREAGNWVLARFGSGARRLALELRARGAMVNVPPYSELDEWLRISTPDVHDVDVFIDVLDTILDSPVVDVDGQLQTRDLFRQPEAWVGAPFVIRNGSDVLHVDHFAITVADESTHLKWVATLLSAGAALVEGPGVWPKDYCEELSEFPADLEMHFATMEVSPGGLLVIAAPRRPGDQLARFRSHRGPWGVHHAAIRVADVHSALAYWQQKGWKPLSQLPVVDDALHQWFLRNDDDQILELIARRDGGQATFTCNNLKALRLSEKR
jgi:histidinol-phosphate aminotransferase